MTTPSNTHPAAVEINGIQYLHDAQGNLVPLANIKAVHLLEDELVRKIVGYGASLSAELARYSMHTDADIAAFDALLAQEYKVEPRETKGNRTFTTYDGLLKVQVAVAQRIRMGASLEEAKAVLDAMIRERGEGVDPFLITLIQRAFKVDQEGKVDVRAILALRRLDVDDPRWPDFCRAIDDAVQPDGSKRYTRLYRRATIQAPWQMVPLDLAAVQAAPAALEHPSLRRQVEQLQAQIAGVGDQLTRLSPVCDTDGDMLAAVKWAVDYVVEDLADIARGKQSAAQVEIADIKAVLQRVPGLPEGITVAGAVEWLVDSIAGMHGWLASAAEDGEHIAASQVLLSLPEITPRQPTQDAE